MEGMLRWLRRCLSHFRPPVTRDEAIAIAVRAIQSEFGLPVVCSSAEAAQYQGARYYLLRSVNFSSAVEQKQVLEEGHDGWAIEFEYRGPAVVDVVECHPCGPLVWIDAATREVELPWRM
jgi:hypothetical protein